MLPELYGIISLEIKKVRQLDDKRPLHELAGNRVPAVIVDKVEVAQRMGMPISMPPKEFLRTVVKDYVVMTR